MKKISVFIVLYLFSATVYSQTCPAPEKFYRSTGTGRYDIVLPNGWLLVTDQRNGRVEKIEFRIAAWGDHKHTSDSVRCHYYDPSGRSHIQLETRDRFDASKLANHGWATYPDDKLYYICVDYDTHDVNKCTFD